MLWLVLITSVWNLVRTWGALTYWEGIQTYAAWPGPTYVAATGVLWAACGLGILIAFWSRMSWASRALLVAAPGYVGWLWMDRLLVQPRIPTSWPFSLLLHALLLAFALAVAVDPRNRYYLGREAHERQEQGRKTA